MGTDIHFVTQKKVYGEWVTQKHPKNELLDAVMALPELKSGALATSTPMKPKFIITALCDDGLEWNMYVVQVYPSGGGISWTNKRSSALRFDSFNEALNAFDRARFYGWILKIEVEPNDTRPIQRERICP